MIVIRAIRPDDRERFTQGFKQFIKSLDSVRFRFHGFKRSLSESEAIVMTEIDFIDHVGLVATFGIDPDQPLIGAGRYIVCADTTKHDRAEVAFAVLDEHQGKGIGSLLLRHLAIIGRAQGVREFQGDVLADNAKMIAVFKNSGFPIERSSELGVERLILTIADEPQTSKQRRKM
ncbi:MAG: GNAT family N-acetyltransferase [Deltaproteobacteria bacterium]|nr:GNAT family N-acetyltransferase [Deltaproteobacteria bacterium]